MNGAKKIGPVIDDQISAKIQRKFDMVFIDKKSVNAAVSNENSDSNLSDSLNFDVEEMVMERNDGSNKNKPKIDFDFITEKVAPVIPEKATRVNSAAKIENDPGFSLDFDANIGKSGSLTKTGHTLVPNKDEDEDIGFTLDDSEIGDVDYNEDATQKTILFNTSMLPKSNLEEFVLEKTGDNNPSIDMMSTEEAKANIESTIKDILRPNPSGETDFSLSNIQSDISNIEDSVLDLGHTPSKSFVLSDIDDGTFAITNLAKEEEEQDKGFNLDLSTDVENDATMDFDLSAITASARTEVAQAAKIEDVEAVVAPPAFTDARPIVAASVETPQYQNTYSDTSSVSMAGLGGSGLNTEDSMRFQATIRALREEREEMLQQIKNLKGDSKELEQDNLTLKANLDEAKIEITILRKRHMVEIEDLKYRASLSEEKKAMADEKAKQADMRREKLEQKVRIDFNQVKQREKELESKLELLSMDVDSQVQSRDQKILELRRKIDALEFNMENASIKEQKSMDDKRKLEDRLNKIMKTLRHSIKNLEDDIDQAEDDGDHQKDKN